MGQVSLEPKNSRGSHVRGRVMLEDCGGICALHMSSMRREEDLVPIMGCPSWAAIRYSWRFYFSFRRADRYLFFWGFLDKTFIYKSSNTCLGKNTLFFLFYFASGMRLVHHFPMVCQNALLHVDLLLVFQHTPIFAFQFWGIF